MDPETFAFNAIKPLDLSMKRTDGTRESIERDFELQKCLESQNILNWWVDTFSFSKLNAVRTTDDGNCLCHAAHQVIHSIEDSEMQLRKSLYNFFLENKEKLRDVWLANASRERMRLDDFAYELSQEESNKEWDEIVNYASPLPVSRFLPNQYKFLEKIHIFALANLLEKPIIVMTEKFITGDGEDAIQLNDIAGIYLPFLSVKFTSRLPEDYVQPIMLAYKNSHFTALKPNSDSELHQIPIVDSSNTLPNFQFIEEATDSMKLSILKNYSHINTVGNILVICWPNDGK